MVREMTNIVQTSHLDSIFHNQLYNVILQATKFEYYII